MSLHAGDVLAPVIPAPSVGTAHFLPGAAANKVDEGAVVSFSVSGVDLCVVNSLRRAIIACVETAAFDTTVATTAGTAGDAGGVRVLENTSVMHNEMLALRVSLVPLCLTPNELENFVPGDYQCKLAVCNTGNEVLDVVSGDFVVRDASGASIPTARLKRLFPVDARSGDSVLLTVLRPNIMCGGVGEAVHITATARRGSGREHARWSPVCSCYFRYKESVVAEEEEDAPPGPPSEFDFFVEGVNPSLSPYYLVFLGFRFLVRAVAALADDVRAARVSFEPAAVPGGMRSVLLPGLDHTVGNLIQGLLYDLWILRGGKARVSFVGYFKRHPLVDDITLKMQLQENPANNNNDDDAAYSDVLLEGLLHVREHVESLTLEWIRFCGLKGMGLVAVEAFVTRTYSAATVGGTVK
jgi:DNA-directed RNA polymerase subunit L